MVTIYDLLEVNEKASKEEIQSAYQKLILEYHKDPKLTPEENANNEIILNKIKIAYEILIDDEKRAQYDKDIAKKRAEELIKNVSIGNKEKEENTESIQEDEKISPIQEQNNLQSEYETNTQEVEIEVDLTKEEQEQLQKAAQAEFQNNLRRAKKAEEEYNKAYNEAYNNYMRQMGYNVKEPMTLKRVMNVVLFIIVTIIVCAIAWAIPPIRNLLTDLYNENIIIKALVDIVGMIVKSIMSIFK